MLDALVLFRDPEIRDEFQKTQLSEVKHSFFSPAVAPFVTLNSPPGVRVPSQSRKQFICLDRRADGSISGKTFGRFEHVQLHRSNATLEKGVPEF